MGSDDIIIRPARDVDEDYQVLVDFRLRMFRDMGWADEARLEELAPLYERYLREHFSVGDFVGWLAEKDGRIVASVGLLWERVPPTVRNLGGRQAYILGMYVTPGSRRQGIAKRMIGMAVDHAREHGADVVSLHYSPEGEGLYTQLGFKESPEMRLFTDPSSALWAPRASAHCDADDAD